MQEHISQFSKDGDIKIRRGATFGGNTVFRK